MRINLKSDQYYDFYNIRKILTSTNYIHIEGNFDKGKKYTMIALNYGMIDPQSLRDLKMYMKKYMKRFDFEGVCPYCEADNIWVKQKQTYKKELNNPKPRYRNVNVEDVNYYCGGCGKTFEKEQLKYSDVILYYT